MEPVLPNGSSVLVDLAARAWEPGQVIALNGGDGMLIRRAGQDDTGRRLMMTDNPDWPDLLLPEGAKVVGRVRCLASWLE